MLQLRGSSGLMQARTVPMYRAAAASELREHTRQREAAAAERLAGRDAAFSAEREELEAKRRKTQRRSSRGAGERPATASTRSSGYGAGTAKRPHSAQPATGALLGAPLGERSRGAKAGFA